MIRILFAFVLLLSLAVDAQVERSVVVEHFTNTLCGICASKNPDFYALLDANPQVIHIAYHPSSPYAMCIFSQHNQPENDARTNFYGIYGGTPRAVLQGEVLSPSTPLVSQEQIDGKLGGLSDYSVLVIQQPAGNGEVSATITVKRLNGNGSENLVLYTALVERSVLYTAPNGEEDHRNVFRKVLQEYSIALVNANDSVVLEKNYAPHPEWDKDEIIVVALLQDMSDKSILQAAVSDVLTSVNDNGVIADLSAAIHPNPVSSLLHFSPAALNKFRSARLFNLFGEMLTSTDLSGPVDMSGYPPGYYFMVFDDGAGNSNTVKVIRSND